MENQFHSGDSLLHRTLISDVTDAKFNIEIFEVLLPARREIVQHPHMITSGTEGLNKI
jgi:hypothetical protein